MILLGKGLALILWLLLAPLGAGLLVARCLPDTRRTAGATYLCGLLSSFVLFEFVAIPCMLLIQYSAFTYTTVIYSILLIALALTGWVLSFRGILNTPNTSSWIVLFPGETIARAESFLSPRTDPRLVKPQYTREGIMYWLLFAGLVAFQLYMAVTRASFDGDDAYYVVESLQAQEIDVMNTIVPYTGISTALDMRHAMAVFTMWIAFIARQSGIHATIVSHTIMPVLLLPVSYLIQLEIGRILLRKRRGQLPIFMVLIGLVRMFGNTSIYTAETFLMMRTWQGKAMVANFSLPLILWVFLWLFEDCRKESRLWLQETGGGRFARNSAWIVLVLVCLSSGIMSSMGVLFGSGLIGVLAFLLLCYTRDWRIIPKTVLALVPNVIYMAAYLFLK
ncbi:MAG: hypothetical protein IJT34_05565 [Butyrivibrio sp.]|nr:hypothetical protein [Butyrivibrio sp.]